MGDPQPADLTKYQSALVVSAHPDDPEFGFGGAIACLVAAGATVNYVICTDGSQGGEDPHVPDQELTRTRYQEQRAAADQLGVREISFLGFTDGHLSHDIELRRAITREIRKYRPDLVMTHHPTRAIGVSIGASHPDHLAVGEATLAAVYPDARNPRAYRDLLAVGLEPHVVREVWMPAFTAPDKVVDITETIDDKLAALQCHASQFQKPGLEEGAPGKWVRERSAKVGEKHGFKYAEGFRRIVTG